MSREFLKSERIRVLVNGIHAKSGGGITYLRNILPILAEDLELEIHLFVHRDQFSLFGIVDERVRIHLLSYPNGFFSNLLWEQFALPVLAKVMSVDVTVSPANYGPLVAPSPIIMLRNSLAVVGKETRPVKRLYWAGLTIMTALSLLTCKRAIAVSNYARKALTFGIGQKLMKKVTIIHHGVKETYSPGEKVERCNYLLAVSDIYVQKNLHTLIQALVLVRKSFPDIHLKVAGKAIDKGYLQEINDSIQINEIGDSIEFIGEQSAEELLEYYRQCKMFVFPSTVETFGNPLVEAMACGAPVLSSNSAAMPEILGDAALFFDPLNAQEMANCIEKVLGDEEMQSELAKKSLRQAKKYSWQITARKTAKVIKEAVPDRYLRVTSNENNSSNHPPVQTTP